MQKCLQFKVLVHSIWGRRKPPVVHFRTLAMEKSGSSDSCPLWMPSPTPSMDGQGQTTYDCDGCYQLDELLITVRREDPPNCGQQDSRAWCLREEEKLEHGHLCASTF